VTSLAGSGDAVATDLRIPGSDTSALPSIFRDLENDALAVDHDTVIRAFESATKGPLHTQERSFALGLSAGVLRLTPKDTKPTPDGAVTTRISGSYDLAHAQMDERIEETLTALPPHWSGPRPSITIVHDGAPGAPQRSFEITNFLNGVAARALARETARVEIYETDIRERALFNARLQAERRAEEERQKAEADRRARIEAARQERLRREQLLREHAEPTTSEPSTAGSPPAGHGDGGSPPATSAR
jgi:hypothetical protein